MKRRLRFIVSAFAISFIIMAGLSFYTMNQFAALNNYSKQVDHTNQIITQLYKIANVMGELDIRERDYMLIQDSAYVDQLYFSSTTLTPVVDSLKRLTQDNSDQQKTLTLLKASLALRYAAIKDNISKLNSQDSTNSYEYYLEGKKHRSEVLQYLNNMLREEQKQLREKSEARQRYERFTSGTIIILSLAFGVITIILFLLLIDELNKRLESQKILQAKLADLKRSHAELEEIAFAASHDLQEPLRKIRIFSNRLLYIKKNETDEDSKQTVDRINYAAGRMQELIDDMVNLTELIKEEGEKEAVNLNDTLKDVLEELDEEVQRKNAVVYHEVLPEITGYRRQFHILFKSLLDNALKFSKTDIAPIISIRCDISSGTELSELSKKLDQKSFYKITISDNGIGFDNKFISKMFQIFQRLHNEETEYPGKGIGLAICQRIMVNHEGYITAQGQPNIGATFRLYFPVNR
jgi:signal transduction histidine kinase